MKNRLQKFMQAEGLSASRLADMLDIQPSNVSHILSGRNKPGYDFLTKILSRFPKLNADWLLLGNGTMYRRIDMGKSEEVASSAGSFPLETSDSNRTSDEALDSDQEQEWRAGESAEKPLQEQSLPLTPQPPVSSPPAGVVVPPLSAASLPGQSPATDVSQVIVLYEDGTFKAYRQR